MFKEIAEFSGIHYTTGNMVTKRRLPRLRGKKKTDLKKTPVATVVFLTLLSGMIYFPIWFLTRRAAINSLHSREKLGKGVFVTGIAVFSLVAVAGLYSGFMRAAALVSGGFDAPTSLNILDLLTNVICLVMLSVLIPQVFKVKRILMDHFNNYLQMNINFSSLLTFLFLNFYLQYKINRIQSIAG